MKMNRKTINDLIHYLPVSSAVIGAPRKAVNMQEYVQNFPAFAEMHTYGGIDFKKEMQDLPSFFQQHAYEETHSLFLAQLERARVWGSNGAIIAQGDYFIKDVSREFNKGMNISHSIYYTLKQARIRQLSGTAAIIGTAGAGIYYHWMMDILPRLGLLENEIPLFSTDHFITGYMGLPFQDETLQKAGIDRAKIIASNNNRYFHVEAARLYVPSFAGPLDQPALFQVQYLQQLYAGEMSTTIPYRHIYISRKKTGRRHLVNEEALTGYLSRFHFEIVYAEEMTVAVQARLFSEASVVVCPHGSALTNLVFCRPGTIVIDIFNASHINACFWFLSQANQLDYHFICGTPVNVDGNPKNDHTIVDLAGFAAIVQQTGI